MKLLSVGRSRRISESKSSQKRQCELISVLGILIGCVFLVSAAVEDKNDSEISQTGGEYVSVGAFSDATEVDGTLKEGEGEREELVMPDKNTYMSPENDSIFEAIGEFFANLIFGD